MLTGKVRRMGNKSLFYLLPLALVASLLTVFSPAEKAYAGPEDITGGSTSSTSAGGSSAGVSSAGSCGTPSTSNPWQICGYSPINQRTRAVSNLPENPWKGVTYADEDSFYTSNFSNDYSGQCQADRRYYTDPVTGQSVMYQPKGIFWVDSRYWVQDSYSYQTYINKLVGSYEYNYRISSWQTGKVWKPTDNPVWYNWTGTKIINGTEYRRANPAWKWAKVQATLKQTYTKYTDRQVAYYCQWPATPSTVSRLCAADVKFRFTGPYGNANTPWPVYTSVNPNKVDYKTLARTWYDPPYNNDGSIVYSPIGWQYYWNGATLGLSNADQVNYIANCGNINATANFRGKPCKMADGTVPAGIDCTFTPGNYNKMSDGNSIACRYAWYPAGTAKAGGVITGSGAAVSLGCGNYQASPYSQDHLSGQAHWVCDDPAGKYGWNSTANFSDCGSPVPPENCKIVGGTGITSPNGDAVANAAQVAADGKQWKFSFPRLDCPAAQNVWTSFVVVGNNANDGSQPFRWSSPANASDQPVVGDVTPNSTTSILGKSGDIRGVAGSSNQDLYLRFYKATKVADSNINFGNYNGLSNKFTVAKDQATPFGVYIEYHLTLPTDTYTNIGGNAVVNKPIVLKSEMLYVYPTSGRVTG